MFVVASRPVSFKVVSWLCGNEPALPAFLTGASPRNSACDVSCLDLEFVFVAGGMSE